MNINLNGFRTFALAAAFTVATSMAGVASTNSPASSVKLLTAKFAPRQVKQVEAGDFHFKPGQVAPIHTHSAPAVGYVAKGAIIYQIEGEKPQVLRAGDAFFEPTGQRILRFDNASATEEAVFIDFNLEQTGEPFIVFEKKLTQAIDRRPLPTVDLGGKSVKQVDIYTTDLPHSASLNLAAREPTLGFVAEGVIELRVKGKATQRIIAGKSFALPRAGSEATVTNASSETSARVITFRLR